MIDWVYGLSLGWLIFVVIAGTGAVASFIWAVVGRLARGERADTLAAVSPGMLPPLGIVFALVVGFLAAGVWNDASNARVAVNDEASALRTADLLVGSFPKPDAARMRALIRAQIVEDVADWPVMARQQKTLTVIPVALADGLRLALQLRPETAGQGVAQRELAVALENWNAQREPDDVLVLLHAAQAAGKPTKADPALEFLHAHGQSDVRVDALASAAVRS